MNSLYKELTQLLRLKRNKTCLYVQAPSNNIAHFFHEQLQYLWIVLSTVSSKDLFVNVDSRQPWIQGISKAITEDLGFRYLNHCPPWWRVKKVDLLIGRPKIYSPGELPKIRDSIYKQCGIKQAQPDLKILYTRADAFRRRIVNSLAIADLFDVIVDNLEISFSQQVELFSRASHFVAPEGAHMTNLVLMNPATSVLSLQVEQKNSWPEIFGTSSLVRRFDADTTVVSGLQPPTATKLPRLGREKKDSLNVVALRKTGDMDIVVDKLLRDVIISFLNDK